MEVLLCECVNDLCHSLFHLLNCLIMRVPELMEISKSHREQGLDYRGLRNCLDTNLAQIVCGKDIVVDWCIVLVKMPLTRFEEY